jgi:hypothetical protein
MISIAFFVSGSARGSNGSGGGGSSAAVEKINQFEVTKTNTEAKDHKTVPIRLSRSAASSVFSLLLKRHEYLFQFFHYFVSHFSATICPDVSVKFSAH